MATSSGEVYARIYRVTKEIPAGKVSTYGQIARWAGASTPRMVGYAMAGAGSKDVPWWRVVNAQGAISPRNNPFSELQQRDLLENEGIIFKANDRISLKDYAWQGPELPWLKENGLI